MRRWTREGILLVLGFALLLVAAWALHRPERKAPPLPAAAVATAEPLPSPREPTKAELLAVTRSLSGAVSVLRSSFRDFGNELDPAAAMLALWSAENMRWSELQRLPEVKHGMVMKDPELARGKLHCNSGSLVEIQVDRSGGAAVYVGGLLSNSGQWLRFVAVQSTGALVQNSPARICGVVTGLQSYSNVAGGMTHAVHVVGMFDLPENRTR